ncbi:hypothetical protein CAPTEDRAFT_104785 [Capitella teleta]|uniref:SRCR domain-containing protein n=1 Tax=Capitella teleta TaxID=283909 RepID=R7UVB5_CAPTE|nr:hypothetical protein CAPTEDRAFT_104785 [Capitella teleta]|eukprot:ELU10578.1 hypothetical protein CAPTEDRAFT_104785 [Capitella teleta]
MKLGTGLEYFHSYDRLNPGLPAIRIAFDDVQCEAREDTFSQCDRSGFLSHDCATAETVGLRCSGGEEVEPCLDECPPGQYEEPTTSICTVCSDRCKRCYASADLCLSCVMPYFLHNDAICQSSCEDGFYGNTISRKCEKCSQACSTCVDGVRGDQCLSCPDGHILHNQEFKECVDVCPESHFIKSVSCLPCSVDCRTCLGSSTNCTSCWTNAFLFNASCRADCPSGFFPNSLGVCQACRYKNCLQCLPGGNYCTSCGPGYVLEKLMCKRKCSAGLFTYNDECLAHCPEGYHPDFTSENCLACNSMCKTCTGPGQACLTCLEGFFLKGTMCVRDCGDGLVAVDLQPANQAVRIVGSMATDGRVEILKEGTLITYKADAKSLFIPGVWSAICSPSWSVNEATVVCKSRHFGEPLLVNKRCYCI